MSSEGDGDDDRGKQGPPTVRRPTPQPTAPTRPSPAALAASREEPPEEDLELVDLVLAEEKPKTSGPRILIVDDNDDLRESLEGALSDAGYSVYQARDGFEALARLTQIPKLSVILLDLMMPRVNGLEFLHEFDKSIYADVPVIILSAYRPEQVELDHYLNESRVFISKGGSPEPLLDVVRQHIGRHR